MYPLDASWWMSLWIGFGMVVLMLLARGSTRSGSAPRPVARARERLQQSPIGRERTSYLRTTTERRR